MKDFFDYLIRFTKFNKKWSKYVLNLYVLLISDGIRGERVGED